MCQSRLFSPNILCFSGLALLLRFAAYPSGNIKLFCTHKRISLICPLSRLHQALGLDQLFFPFGCCMFCEGLSHRVSWSTLALGLSFDFPYMPKNVPNRASPIVFSGCITSILCGSSRSWK